MMDHQTLPAFIQTIDYQDLLRSNVGAALGRKAISTLCPSSGFTFKLAEVKMTGTSIERLVVSSGVPEDKMRSM